MQNTEAERKEFLQLCGEKDRRLLTDTGKMSLGDFDRLTYIADFLGFTDYNLSLWDQVAPQFKEQFDHLTKLLEDSDIAEWPDEMESECHLHDMWLMDFLNNIPDEDLKQSLSETMERLYHEQGWEYPEQGSIP